MSNFWLQLINIYDVCLWERGVDPFYSPRQNLDSINPVTHEYDRPDKELLFTHVNIQIKAFKQ